MTIHHYESNYRWSDDANFNRFDKNDVVIAPDAQRRLDGQAFAVCEIDHEGAIERVTQRGLFWKVEEARRYAKSLHRDTHHDN